MRLIINYDNSNNKITQILYRFYDKLRDIFICVRIFVNEFNFFFNSGFFHIHYYILLLMCI